MPRSDRMSPTEVVRFVRQGRRVSDTCSRAEIVAMLRDWCTPLDPEVSEENIARAVLLRAIEAIEGGEE